MASISAYDSYSISTLFSSLNSAKSSSSSMNFGINLSDYGLIRSGSYYKMMKAYYETDASGSAKSSWIGSTTTSTAADSVKTLAQVESAADDLSNSSKDLYTTGSKSLFKTESKTDSNGKTTREYNTEEIYKAVKSFVSDYNSLVSAAGKSNTTKIANAAASMVNVTKVNANMLKEVGITIDTTDYTLKLDEDTFKNADMSKVKSLFNGNGSYAYNTAVKASMINSYAKMESSKSNTYNGSGNYTYNYSTGALYSDSF